MATFLDAPAVAPDGVGRFTFGLRGTPAPGSYSEAFNLIAQSVRWFDYGRLGSYYVPIVVTDVAPCAATPVNRTGKVPLRPCLP